jgi:hypothetical protein
MAHKQFADAALQEFPIVDIQHTQTGLPGRALR